MKIIYTKKLEEILVDDDDYEKFGHLKWCLSGGYPVTRRLDGTNGLDKLSRLVMGIERGDRVRVDYVSGNLLDNQKENFRIRVSGHRSTDLTVSERAAEAIAKKEAELVELAKHPQRIFTSNKGNEVLYSSEDWPILCRYLWLENAQGYAYCNIPQADPGRQGDPGRRAHILMHRLIIGPLPDGIYTDHINGNRLDNRRENLRPCTPAENARNTKRARNNTSGYKGVSFNKLARRWSAQIRLNGKERYLGIYDSPEDAHKAYCKAAEELYGEFANFGA